MHPHTEKNILRESTCTKDFDCVQKIVLPNNGSYGPKETALRAPEMPKPLLRLRPGLRPYIAESLLWKIQNREVKFKKKISSHLVVMWVSDVPTRALFISFLLPYFAAHLMQILFGLFFFLNQLLSNLN